MLKAIFMGGVAITSIAQGEAHAQTTTPAATQVADNARTVQVDPAAQSVQPITSEGLRDIIVTATKVETVLQRTPQAITAIDGRSLVQAGVATAQDLNKLVPGLQIEQNGSSSSIYIRGVGSRVVGPNQDPAVAFSVDGVYYSRASGTTTTLFDLDRIEVVKGPQGTLYGRNATGGAVNVVSRRPRIGERSVDGEIEVGNFNAVRAVVGVNLPLGERAALRIAGQSNYNSGFLSDGYNDTNIKAVRLGLLVEPTPALLIFVRRLFGPGRSGRGRPFQVAGGRLLSARAAGRAEHHRKQQSGNRRPRHLLRDTSDKRHLCRGRL